MNSDLVLKRGLHLRYFKKGKRFHIFRKHYNLTVCTNSSKKMTIYVMWSNQENFNYLLCLVVCLHGTQMIILVGWFFMFSFLALILYALNSFPLLGSLLVSWFFMLILCTSVVTCFNLFSCRINPYFVALDGCLMGGMT